MQRQVETGSAFSILILMFLYSYPVGTERTNGNWKHVVSTNENLRQHGIQGNGSKSSIPIGRKEKYVSNHMSLNDTSFKLTSKTSIPKVQNPKKSQSQDLKNKNRNIHSLNWNRFKSKEKYHEILENRKEKDTTKRGFDGNDFKFQTRLANSPSNIKSTASQISLKSRGTIEKEGEEEATDFISSSRLHRNELALKSRLHRSQIDRTSRHGLNSIDQQRFVRSSFQDEPNLANVMTSVNTKSDDFDLHFLSNSDLDSKTSGSLPTNPHSVKTEVNEVELLRNTALIPGSSEPVATSRNQANSDSNDMEVLAKEDMSSESLGFLLTKQNIDSDAEKGFGTLLVTLESPKDVAATQRSESQNRKNNFRDESKTVGLKMPSSLTTTTSATTTTRHAGEQQQSTIGSNDPKSQSFKSKHNPNIQSELLFSGQTNQISQFRMEQGQQFSSSSLNRKYLKSTTWDAQLSNDTNDREATFGGNPAGKFKAKSLHHVSGSDRHPDRSSLIDYYFSILRARVNYDSEFLRNRDEGRTNAVQNGAFTVTERNYWDLQDSSSLIGYYFPISRKGVNYDTETLRNKNEVEINKVQNGASIWAKRAPSNSVKNGANTQFPKDAKSNLRLHGIGGEKEDREKSKHKTIQSKTLTSSAFFERVENAQNTEVEEKDNNARGQDITLKSDGLKKERWRNKIKTDNNEIQGFIKSQTTPKVKIKNDKRGKRRTKAIKGQMRCAKGNQNIDVGENNGRRGENRPRRIDRVGRSRSKADNVERRGEGVLQSLQSQELSTGISDREVSQGIKSRPVVELKISKRHQILGKHGGLSSSRSNVRVRNGSNESRERGDLNKQMDTETESGWTDSIQRGTKIREKKDGDFSLKVQWNKQTKNLHYGSQEEIERREGYVQQYVLLDGEKEKSGEVVDAHPDKGENGEQDGLRRQEAESRESGEWDRDLFSPLHSVHHASEVIEIRGNISSWTGQADRGKDGMDGKRDIDEGVIDKKIERVERQTGPANDESIFQYKSRMTEKEDGENEKNEGIIIVEMRKIKEDATADKKTSRSSTLTEERGDGEQKGTERVTLEENYEPLKTRKQTKSIEDENIELKKDREQSEKEVKRVKNHGVTEDGLKRRKEDNEEKEMKGRMSRQNKMMQLKVEGHLSVRKAPVQEQFTKESNDEMAQRVMEESHHQQEELKDIIKQPQKIVATEEKRKEERKELVRGKEERSLPIRTSTTDVNKKHERERDLDRETKVPSTGEEEEEKDGGELFDVIQKSELTVHDATKETSDENSGHELDSGILPTKDSHLFSKLMSESGEKSQAISQIKKDLDGNESDSTTGQRSKFPHNEEMKIIKDPPGKHIDNLTDTISKQSGLTGKQTRRNINILTDGLSKDVGQTDSQTSHHNKKPKFQPSQNNLKVRLTKDLIQTNKHSGKLKHSDLSDAKEFQSYFRIPEDIQTTDSVKSNAQTGHPTTQQESRSYFDVPKHLQSKESTQSDLNIDLNFNKYPKIWIQRKAKLGHLAYLKQSRRYSDIYFDKHSKDSVQIKTETKESFVSPANGQSPNVTLTASRTSVLSPADEIWREVTRPLLYRKTKDKRQNTVYRFVLGNEGVDRDYVGIPDERLDRGSKKERREIEESKKLRDFHEVGLDEKELNTESHEDEMKGDKKNTKNFEHVAFSKEGLKEETNKERMNQDHKKLSNLDYTESSEEGLQKETDDEGMKEGSKKMSNLNDTDFDEKGLNESKKKTKVKTNEKTDEKTDDFENTVSKEAGLNKKRREINNGTKNIGKETKNYFDAFEKIGMNSRSKVKKDLAKIRFRRDGSKQKQIIEIFSDLEMKDGNKKANLHGDQRLEINESAQEVQEMLKEKSGNLFQHDLKFGEKTEDSVNDVRKRFENYLEMDDVGFGENEMTHDRIGEVNKDQYSSNFEHYPYGDSELPLSSLEEDLSFSDDAYGNAMWQKRSLLSIEETDADQTENPEFLENTSAKDSQFSDYDVFGPSNQNDDIEYLPIWNSSVTNVTVENPQSPIKSNVFEDLTTVTSSATTQNSPTQKSQVIKRNLNAVATHDAQTQPEKPVVKIGVITAHRHRLWLIQYIRPAIHIAAEKINASDGPLPGYEVRLLFRDSKCSETFGSLEGIDLYVKKLAHVFIGPGCDYSVAPLARFSYYWGGGIPLVTAGALVAAFDNKSEFKLLTRMQGSYPKMAPMFLSLLLEFNWVTPGFVYHDYRQDVTNKRSDCSFAIEPSFIFVHRVTRIRPWFIAFNEKNTTRDTYEELLWEMKKNCRIVILCASPDTVREIMIKAHELNFDNGEYVFLNIDLFSSKNDSQTPWHRVNDTEERNMKARKAYEALMTVTLRMPTSDAYREFSNDVKTRAAIMYPNFTYGEDEVNSFVGAFHDAVLLYAIALNETLAEQGSISDGKAITKKMWNRTFEGITGNVSIDANGDRNADYSLLDLNPETNQFEVVANYFGNKRMYEPVEGKTIHWAGGRKGPPPDSPKCGFDGSKCPPDEPFPEYAIVIIVLGSMLLIVLIAVFFIYRHIKLEAELAEMNWRVRWDDILFGALEKNKKLERQGSRLSLRKTSLPSDCSGDTIAVHLNDASNRQLFTRTGYYKGAIIAIKPISRTNITISKPLLLEIKRMKDLQNDHIVRFVGACIDFNHHCILTEYCPKGSLQDVLENEQIKLDWMFRYSIMQDIVRGMAYLQGTEIRSHGYLKSTNCVVDSRFVVKITDFGLHHLRGDQRMSEGEEGSYSYFNNRLWSAPELLRLQFRPPEGTIKGDVYSFAIICQEIVYRNGVFYLQNLDLAPQEIFQKVKSGQKPFFRPTLEEYDCPCDELAVVIRRCWAEDPADRPDFQALKSIIRKLNRDGDKGNILDNLLSRMEQYANNLEALVEERTADYLQQKRKAEDLLYNMLPKKVASQLIRGESVTAEWYDNVSIYFSDICGFTALSAESTPMQVVDLLNDLYTTFDSIIENFDVYKVETIGDAYMVVSGLPDRNGNVHAREIARMSLSLLKATLTFRIRHRPNDQLKLRIGIHTGPVCAGVVGLKMPRYCLFGDTVNTASRMESNGQPLKIHVSPQCREVLETFNCFDLECRGNVEMKGKGVVRTYWLLGERSPIDSPGVSLNIL